MYGMRILGEIGSEIQRLTGETIRRQQKDGSWRFCCDSGTSIDAYMIILLRSLQFADETLIRKLHNRIAAAQRTDGSWRAYVDESEGNLSASVDAYYAMLYSGCSHASDAPMRMARQYILSKGGLPNVSNVLTKVFLAATGQYRWPEALKIPLEIMLLPASLPVSFFDFSAYARVHLAPILLMADRRFVIKTDLSPDISELTGDEQPDNPDRCHEALLDQLKIGIGKLTGIPRQLHETATKRVEQFMLERIEPDGTLYSYATSTFLMIFALLALGCDKRNPNIISAVRGLIDMLCKAGDGLLMQNTPSAIWDTALLTHALQEAGVSNASGPIRNAASYLLAKQHRLLGDWRLHNRNPVPGGWGFSDSNTINPDIDDTTAALRAIRRLSPTGPHYLNAWNRGLNWVLSMQNSDGGWPAFEKDTDNELLALLPVEGAESAAIDPSTADLTGRTLEFLGNTAGLGSSHAVMRRGTEWLLARQETDGSWYGRWGICYIYGTWAALTGLLAAGLKADHPSVLKGARWLLENQNTDGGWGESCASDRMMHYVALGASSPVQTAWALDSLIAAHPEPTPAIDAGIRCLIASLHKDDWTTVYPTGGGLPGLIYNHYHSYRYIWPLLTLSRYRNKYGEL